MYPNVTIKNFIFHAKKIINSCSVGISTHCVDVVDAGLMPTRKVSLPNSLAFLRPPLACLKYRLDPAPGLLPASHFLRLPQAWNSAGGRRCNQVMLRTSCRPGSAPARSGWPPPRGCWPGDLSDPSWRCLTVANLKRFGN